MKWLLQSGGDDNVRMRLEQETQSHFLWSISASQGIPQGPTASSGNLFHTLQKYKGLCGAVPGINEDKGL